ncbi:MAG: hypothetical protein KDK37_15960 [Leptospiraceae bacterium]|nr:hypothetical protein [Leptospiraceae bacterium]MCB1305784.1 hypothetical protein [Leptospiraceae bacterium]
MKGTIASVILAALLLGAIAYIPYNQNRLESEQAQRISEFKEELHRTERFYIENLPIYEDWQSGDKESELRRYLLNDHLRVVKEAGLSPLQDANQIQEFASQGKLASIDLDSVPFYFYNVQKPYRYLTPAAKKGLLRLAERFQQVVHRNLDGKDAFKPVIVKFAISSALRPIRYQSNLRNENPNASFVSSHSYGLSFDLFYDSFYVNLRSSENKFEDGSPQEALDRLKLQSGFLLGSSLRRQFRAALAETLLQLQKEGLLYAIYERNQRCYHVTILPGAVD